MGVDETCLAVLSQEIRVDEEKMRAQGTHFAIAATALGHHNFFGFTRDILSMQLLVHRGLILATACRQENYVNNAYLWLLIGILFRLPKPAQMPQPVPLPKHARGMAGWQLATGGR